MQTKGWFRLWIMATIVWLGVVAFYTWQKWPLPETTTHKPDFLSKVMPQTALSDCPPKGSDEECEKLAAIVVTMPNGYRLRLSLPDTDPDSLAAAKSYWQAVELASGKQANAFLLSAGMIWLGSSVAVLLFGIGIVWVIRGFRSHP